MKVADCMKRFVVKVLLEKKGQTELLVQLVPQAGKVCLAIQDCRVTRDCRAYRESPASTG